MAAVSVDNVSRSYGERKALDGVSFTVGEGEFFALLGPNGGGKSTLFRILATLLAPDSGSARILGHDVVADAAAVRRRIGVVFQNPALDKKLTCLENLSAQGNLHGLSGRELKQSALQWLSRVGLGDRIQSPVGELSGGLQRRLDIARALLPSPSLLLLDEPTTGLDPRARREVWDIVHRLRKEDGTTVLTTTHFLEEAEGADSLALLDLGRVVALGTPGELKGMLGGDVIAVRGSAPVLLKEKIEGELGSPVQLVDGEVRIETKAGGETVARLVSRFRDEIDSITLGKPTLEDLFLLKTGRRLGAGAELSAAKRATLKPVGGRRGSVEARP